MKILRVFLIGLAVAAVVSAGIGGCAKKQVKEEGGRIEQVKPGEGAEKGAKEGEKPSESTREAKEAPPGPSEQPEPVETPRAEKALEDIHFDFDKYDLRAGDMAILQHDADWMKKNPKTFITVEGHCDERGTVEYNLALGERRAAAAKNYLVSLGIGAGRMKTISYGKGMPLDPGHSEDAWAKNRRAHFVVH